MEEPPSFPQVRRMTRTLATRGSNSGEGEVRSPSSTGILWGIKGGVGTRGGRGRQGPERAAWDSPSPGCKGSCCLPRAPTTGSGPARPGPGFTAGECL